MADSHGQRTGQVLQHCDLKTCIMTDSLGQDIGHKTLCNEDMSYG